LPPETETDKVAESETQEEEADLQLQKKLGYMTPNVRFSGGLEEVMDVAAAIRRGRGRPKKAENTGKQEQKETVPPDPHKASVTDGVEGMCVDPGEMEAILEAEGARGPGPPGGGKGRQLASDSGGS
jgi:hypothetical protein